MDEPSLLDYLKTRLSLKRLFSKDAGIQTETEPEAPSTQPASHPGFSFHNFPWRSILALTLALLGQRSLEPGTNDITWGEVFYIAALGMLVFALVKKEWTVPVYPTQSDEQLSLTVRKTSFFFFIPLLIISFVAFTVNKFTGLNLVLWIATFLAALGAFWIPSRKWNMEGIRNKVVDYFRNPFIKLNLSPWNLLVIAVFLVSAFYHLHQLNTVTLEMTSDHAEKLLDVNDVLNGNYSIFFPRNSGREPIQFYLSAFLIKVFGTGVNFYTLKLGMALAFLASLYFVYQLGKEVGNRWTGLFAILLIGFASWTNIIARVGMRLVLTPVFVAPTLLFFLRAMRKNQRNDFILSGIFLGLGLMGYSASRIVPLVIILGLIVYLFHSKFDRSALDRVWGVGLLALFALVAALPLMRFMVQYPDVFNMRTITRMTGAEQAIQDPVLVIFFQNLKKALAMPFWKDGSTWVISVPDRPALDVISAAFYLIGIVLLIYRWVKTRAWQDFFLLFSIPVLMLPSILALAFPAENPSLSRAGGAVIPILIISAIGFDTLFSSLWVKAQKGFGKVVLILFAGVLLFFSARQNYDLVFDQYATSYNNATWNTSQIGEIAKDYIGTFGSPDTVWVVGVAHWVDTRLVAMNAGFPDRDYAIWPADLETTLADTRAKLFFVKINDSEGLSRLQSLYPNGFLTYHSSLIQGREFYTYIVPPVGGKQ